MTTTKQIKHDRQELAALIRTQREALGLSQTALAVCSGVHTRTIQRLEDNAGNWPALDTLLTICDVLKIELSAEYAAPIATKKSE